MWRKMFGVYSASTMQSWISDAQFAKRSLTKFCYEILFGSNAMCNEIRRFEPET